MALALVVALLLAGCGEAANNNQVPALETEAVMPDTGLTDPTETAPYPFYHR